MKKILILSFFIISSAHATNYQVEDFQKTCDKNGNKEIILRVGDTVAISERFLKTQSYKIKNTMAFGDDGAILFLEDGKGWNDSQIRKSSIQISKYGDQVAITSSTAVIFKNTSQLLSAVSSLYLNCE